MKFDSISPEKLCTAAPWLIDDTLWKEGPLAVSPYGSLFLKGSHAVLYHSLTMQTLVGDEALILLWQFFSVPGGAHYCTLPEGLKKPEVMRTLLAREFLVPPHEDWHRRLRAQRQMARADNSFFSRLMVPIKTAPGKGKAPDRAMFLHDVSSLMERFFARAEARGVRRPVIALNVAGKTLPFERISQIFSLARGSHRGGRFDEVLTTMQVPSTLVDDELARLCAASFTEVTLGWDGGSRIGSHTRFTLAMEGYRKLQMRGVRISLSCLLSAELLCTIEKLAEFFACDLECASLRFSFPGPPGGRGKLPAELVGARLFKLYERLRLYGVSVNPPGDRVEAFISKKPLFIEKDRWDYGRSRAPAAVSPLFSDQDYQALPVFRTDCQFCPAIGLCGIGGPGHAAKGGESSPEPGRCRFQLITLQWLLDEMLRAMNLHPREGSMMLLPGRCL